MKKFYQIDRPDISDEQALKHKNFEQVMTDFNTFQQPWYKSLSMWGIATGVVSVIIVAVLFLINSGEENQLPPHISELDVPFETFTIEATDDTVIITESKSRIHIRSGIFVDQDGQAVSGKVDLKYREMRDPIDFILSRVPMTYDSASATYHFESAGMFEIQAWQGDQKLAIKPSETVRIDMLSKQEAGFNLYQFDEANKEWDYIARETSSETGTEDTADLSSEIEPLAIDEELENIKREIEVIEKAKPSKPTEADPFRHQVTLDVDPEEFPELNAYEGVQFEVRNPEFNQQKANVLWEDVKIEKSEQEGAYQLTFYKGKDSYSFIAWAVFEGKNYDQAMAEYHKRYADYEQKLAERKRLEKEKAEALKAAQERLERERKEKLAEIQANVERAQLNYNRSQKKIQTVYRTFNINQFGIWNADLPRNLPSGIPLAVKFTTTENENINFQCAYHVEKDINAVYTYKPTNIQNFRFNADSENYLVVVTKEGDIGYCRDEEFDRISKKAKTHNFQLKMVSRDIESPEEVKSLIGL